MRRYTPDVVLLDIGMPDLSGFEIGRKLRDEMGGARPVLIAITAWKQEKAQEVGKLAGFHHYMTKPYELEELLEILKALALSRPAP